MEKFRLMKQSHSDCSNHARIAQVDRYAKLWYNIYANRELVTLANYVIAGEIEYPN